MCWPHFIGRRARRHGRFHELSLLSPPWAWALPRPVATLHPMARTVDRPDPVVVGAGFDRWLGGSVDQWEWRGTPAADQEVEVAALVGLQHMVDIQALVAAMAAPVGCVRCGQARGQFGGA